MATLAERARVLSRYGMSKGMIAAVLDVTPEEVVTAQADVEAALADAGGPSAAQEFSDDDTPKVSLVYDLENGGQGALGVYSEAGAPTTYLSVYSPTIHPDGSVEEDSQSAGITLGAHAAGDASINLFYWDGSDGAATLGLDETGAYVILLGEEDAPVLKTALSVQRGNEQVLLLTYGGILKLGKPGGGLTLTSPDGLVTKKITIGNDGEIALL